MYVIPVGSGIWQGYGACREYPVNLNKLKKMPTFFPNFTCVAGGDLMGLYSGDEYCIRHCLQVFYSLDVLMRVGQQCFW